MDIGLMIEGQAGLTWPRWKRVLDAAEELGFAHVFRSDHLAGAQPPDEPALDLWASLTYAASHTQRIQFGPLVIPVTFRLPAMAAWVAKAVDELSDGRLTLGIGAGWNEREHRMFGIPLPPTAARFGMLHDYLEVVIRLLRSAEPVTYDGQYYQLDQAILLPPPARANSPAILVGGNGLRRTLPLAARFADEWNGSFLSPEGFGERQQRLDTLLDEIGRPRDAVRRSVMVGTIFARDESALRERLAKRGWTVAEANAHGLVVGTSPMWVEQIQAYGELGADRIMLQWLDLDDIAGIGMVAREVLPAFRKR